MPDRTEAGRGRPLSPDEPALIERARGGDTAAFEALVERHQDAVFRFARTLTRDDARAEDALQETFLAALTALPAWRAESSLRTWLLVIARNACHRAHRRDREVATDDEDLGPLGAAAGWGCEDPETALGVRETREAVSRALDTLDDDDRALLVLREVEGLTGDETAAVLGLTTAAMKSRLHRARLRFAAALRRGGPHDV